MSDTRTFDGMIAILGADLRPVSRLSSPWLRAGAWIGIVAGLAVLFCCVADVSAMRHRLGAAPDMWLAALGSTLTTVLAAIATFQLSVPNRRDAWALAPLVGLALWVGASGLGCMRDWAVPGVHQAAAHEVPMCLTFIIGLSVPLSGLMVAMVRRAYPLRPNLTVLVGGLAVASAAATLLNFFHPYDATASDLMVHAVAVLIVVVVNRIVGGRALIRSMPGRSVSEL